MAERSGTRKPVILAVDDDQQVLRAVERDLLTAYADTDAAIRAINDVGLGYYLQKPWDPPEKYLYPILDDQLEEWLSGFKPPFERVRLVGDRWSPDLHRIRDFLARNRVPVERLKRRRGSREGEKCSSARTWTG